MAEATAVPVDGSAEALSLSISLESSGLVHLVVRRAGTDILPGHDHAVMYKGLHEANLTSPASDQRPRGGKGPGAAKATVVEVVEGLEPNSTYEVREAPIFYRGSITRGGPYSSRYSYRFFTQRSIIYWEVLLAGMLWDNVRSSLGTIWVYHTMENPTLMQRRRSLFSESSTLSAVFRIALGA